MSRYYAATSVGAIARVRSVANAGPVLLADPVFVVRIVPTSGELQHPFVTEPPSDEPVVVVNVFHQPHGDIAITSEYRLCRVAGQGRLSLLRDGGLRGFQEGRPAVV